MCNNDVQKEQAIEDGQTFIKIIRIKGVELVTGLSKSTIYNKTNPKSSYYDVTFPKPVRLGAGSVGGSVGWIEGEVFAWIQSRPRA